MTANDAPAGSPAEQPFQTELLFTDGLPQMDDEVGYRGAVAARPAAIGTSDAVIAFVPVQEADAFASTMAREFEVVEVAAGEPARLEG